MERRFDRDRPRRDRRVPEVRLFLKHNGLPLQLAKVIVQFPYRKRKLELFFSLQEVLQTIESLWMLVLTSAMLGKGDLVVVSNARRIRTSL